MSIILKSCTGPWIFDMPSKLWINYMESKTIEQLVLSICQSVHKFDYFVKLQGICSICSKGRKQTNLSNFAWEAVFTQLPHCCSGQLEGQS